jgi:hypothetical protein
MSNLWGGGGVTGTDLTQRLKQVIENCIKWFRARYYVEKDSILIISCLIGNVSCFKIRFCQTLGFVNVSFVCICSIVKVP